VYNSICGRNFFYFSCIIILLQNCFELFSLDGVIKAWKKDSEGKAVPGNHELYRLQATSEDDCSAWMRCIEANIQPDTVYDTFNQRKRRIASVQGLMLPGFD